MKFPKLTWDARIRKYVTEQSNFTSVDFDNFGTVVDVAVGPIAGLSFVVELEVVDKDNYTQDDDMTHILLVKDRVHVNNIHNYYR